MPKDVPAATGSTRRRRRLSDQESESRMLHTALTMVNNAGLTVSLEHFSFEDVIRQAEVSRSAAYRRWPYKDLFFSDLLLELARGAAPASITGPEPTELLQQAVGSNVERLETPEHRHDVLVELLRLGASMDFQAIRASPQWRTYIALHASFQGLEDGELRDAVGQALAEAEQASTARIAGAYQHAAEMLGYRLKPSMGIGFSGLAAMVSATMRGTVIMTLSNPELAEQHVTATPFEATHEHEWSYPALALAGIVTAFLEPDPDITWDARQLEKVRQELHSPS